jgi:hypothetical protein
MILFNKLCIPLSLFFMVDFYSQGNYGMSLYFLGCMVLNICAVGLS